MKKLAVLGAGAIATAIASAALLSPAVAESDPAPAALNVVGEPYARAVAILKSKGAPYMFGGSVGSDVPQAQCIVVEQLPIRGGQGGKYRLTLDCTREAVAAASGGLPSGPIPGANGITTITMTPVPRPGTPPPPAPSPAG